MRGGGVVVEKVTTWASGIEKRTFLEEWWV
jgi:hypothetical protein